MKVKIIGGLLTLIICVLLFFVGMDTRVAGNPIEVFQVYLNGEKIGLINDKDELYNLIDTDQVELKEKYDVDKVYPPEGLDVRKVYTYNDDVKPVSEIYQIIKEREPFTIEGYTATIVYEKIKDENGNEVGEQKPDKKIYLLNKDDMKTALYKTATAFIGEVDLKKWEDGTQVEITETGEIIDYVNFEENITIKEDLVSTNEYIFKDADELSRYLLFGTLEKQKTYTTKSGENLEVIAEANQLNIEELLIANPQFPSENVLLTEGEKINIGLIAPLVSVVYHKTVVDDIKVSYKTEYINDSTKYTSYKEVTTKGQDGIERITQDVLYKNGEIQSLHISKREDIKQTVNQVITRGTKKISGGFQTYIPGADGWAWPTVRPFIITSTYGWRWGKMHRGIDISGTGKGSPIYSSTDGVVQKINNNCSNSGYYGSSCGGGHGNYIYIKSTDGYLIYYSHLLNNVKVKAGQTVKRGQLIGYMGNSGSSTGTHLHYQIQSPSGAYLNPCKSVFKC